MSLEGGAGTPRLRPVPLQELRLRAESLVWPVGQKLAELDSLTAVRGQVWARHHGNVLEVEGEAETIVTLCCDRCLQHFNSTLQVKVHELLELAGVGTDEPEAADLTALAGSQARHGSRSKAAPQLLEIEVLDDRLDPRGDFDPERWLFEQLSLQLPVVNRCGADCPGPPLPVGDASPRAAHASGSLTLVAGSSGWCVSHPAAAGSQDTRTRQSSASTAIPGLHASPSQPPSPDLGPIQPSKAAEPEPPLDPRWAALRQLLP